MAGGQEQMELIRVEPSPTPDRPAAERTEAQRAAVAARDRDLFTEAGAGAGKTGVLVERYCDCVTEDEVSPERILAFTFTERAAGELRQRVHRELSARAWAATERGDHLLAREIARAAREGERAWITTRSTQIVVQTCQLALSPFVGVPERYPALAIACRSPQHGLNATAEPDRDRPLDR